MVDFDKLILVKDENMERTDDKNDLMTEQMFGIPLFGRSEVELLDWLTKEIDIVRKQPVWVATVNPEFVMNASKDRDFLEMLKRRTTVNVIDGVGLIWALKVQKGFLPIRVGWEILRGKHRENLITGADLVDKMCQLAEEKKKSVYFFGGWGDRARRTAEYFLKKYPKLKVAGYKDENFDYQTEADFLFVARGMKKQEIWIDKSLDKLKVKVVMGVGRSFDYYSGELKRAPSKIRKMGLEWLYSLFKEPKRWKRQLALPKFIVKVLFQSRG